MPNLAPLLLPWLVVLVLLALPSNRDPRAWWIWAPLIGLVLLGAGLDAAFTALDYEDLGGFIQAALAVSFGLAAVWLLAGTWARRGQVVGIVASALACAGIGLLAFVVAPIWEEVWGLRQWVPLILLWLALFATVIGLVYANALRLTGWSCRRRSGGVRVSLWLLLWLWMVWTVVAALFVGVLAIFFHNGFEWMGLLVGAIMLSLLSFAVILPFLILSFTSSFYRERLKNLLRLPAVVSAPAAPAPTPTAEQGSPQ